MSTHFCPSCGSSICLSDKLDYVYCECCGNKAFSKDVLRFHASPQLLASEDRLRKLSGEVLLMMSARTDKAHKKKPLQIADEKGYLPASLQLGIDYCCEGNWNDCEQYLKRANEGGYPEAEALLLICQDKKSNTKNLYDLLKKLQACSRKKFDYENIKQYCASYINYVQNRIYEQEREERLRSWAQDSYVPSPIDVGSSSSSSDGAGAYGYPDVYGPSYHPDAPKYDPETISPGEIW